VIFVSILLHNLQKCSSLPLLFKHRYDDGVRVSALFKCGEFFDQK
jgi:hypothetical protein